jgi:hypothetical protein
VEGLPVSGITIRFLCWCSAKLYARAKKVWLLIWENAPWHVSKEARYWIKEHNHKLKKGALEGVRIISCSICPPGLTPNERTISAYATAVSSIVACSYSDGLR